MKITVTPRSDQWNADDFMGGPRTFTIAGVQKGKAEQPYDVELVEGEGRAWRPPNGMLSVLVQLWGSDAAQWQGRRVTLFRDPAIRFGKETPGGIRISHMSDIGEKPVSPPITVSRGKKAPYKVMPLPNTDTTEPTIPDNVRETVERVKGTDSAADYIKWAHDNNAPDHIIEYIKTNLEEN